MTLALASAAVVLAFFIKVIIDVGTTTMCNGVFNPNSSTSAVRHLLGVLYGVLIFRRVRDRGEPRGGNEGAETSHPQAVLTSVVVVSSSST